VDPGDAIPYKALSGSVEPVDDCGDLKSLMVVKALF
jgi:hypothetical protein